MHNISSVYRARDPQNSTYYHCVEDNFETFEQVYEDPPALPWMSRKGYLHEAGKQDPNVQHILSTALAGRSF